MGCFPCSFFKASLDFAEKVLAGFIPKKVRLTKNMIRGLRQSGNRVYYTLKLKRSTGRALTVGSYLPSRKSAETVAEHMQGAIATEG